jgi:hypothetical protein
MITFSSTSQLVRAALNITPRRACVPQKHTHVSSMSASKFLRALLLAFLSTSQLVRAARILPRAEHVYHRNTYAPSMSAGKFLRALLLAFLSTSQLVRAALNITPRRACVILGPPTQTAVPSVLAGSSVVFDTVRIQHKVENNL